MKVAIMDGMIAGESIAQKFEKAAGYGFDGIEIWVSGDSNLGEIEREVKQSARSTGLDVLQVVVLSEPWYSPIKNNKGVQDKIAAQKVCIELSANVGGHFSQIVPEYGPQFVPLAAMSSISPEEEKYFLEFLAESADFASQFNLLLVVDVINRYETRYYRRLGDLPEVLAELQKPNVKAIADFFHMSLEEPDTEKAIETAGKLIGQVHLADNNRSLPGDGNIDFESGFRSLKKIGYDGYMSFEAQGDFISDPDTQLPLAVKYVREAWNRD